MKSLKKEKLKEELLEKSMKMVGSVSLLLSEIVMTPTCWGMGHQPKCPDELLK
ncbi:cyclic lactone autoinducer peptide [Clostridium sp. WILCCON 0269]|uniref:Cyclic lactone autoinducer peptide n=1 Tax=Candidatus Clostridium eludens TaxID=3381663 RepID=A0ABW8SLK2_9CLOT